MQTVNMLIVYVTGHYLTVYSARGFYYFLLSLRNTRDQIKMDAYSCKPSTYYFVSWCTIRSGWIYVSTISYMEFQTISSLYAHHALDDWSKHLLNSEWNKYTTESVDITMV